MKLSLILILLINCTYLQGHFNYENFEKLKDFDIYMSYFKEIDLPLVIDETKINELMDIEENQLGRKLPFHFLNIIFNKIFTDEIDSNSSFLLYPIGKFSNDNIIITIIYHKGGAGGFNEEYYISVFKKDGNFLETMNIATYNGDASGIFLMEAKIDKNLNLTIKSKRYKTIETTNREYQKLIKENILHYKIDKNTGVILKTKKQQNK